VPVKE